VSSSSSLRRFGVCAERRCEYLNPRICSHLTGACWRAGRGVIHTSMSIDFEERRRDMQFLSQTFWKKEARNIWSCCKFFSCIAEVLSVRREDTQDQLKQFIVIWKSLAEELSKISILVRLRRILGRGERERRIKYNGVSLAFGESRGYAHTGLVFWNKRGAPYHCTEWNLDKPKLFVWGRKTEAR
jgi:hypothetical protein